MVLWNVYFPNSLISVGRLIYRLDSSIILKVITREGPVKKKMVGKKTKKEEGIKGTPLRKIKVKIRSRIKDNLINLVERKPSTLIISLPDFVRRVSAINV